MAADVSKNRYGGLDPHVVQNIRATARRLARANAVPGMDAEDFEQDLVADLWRRQDAYDPSRASFRTFAARIVANRVATLTAPTAQLAAARRTASLEDRVGLAPDDAVYRDVLPDSSCPDEDAIALVLDVEVFFHSLSPALKRACAILLAENRADEAHAAQIHRSTLYENVHRLRAKAIAEGLGIYRARPRQIRGRAGMCSMCRCVSRCTGCEVCGQ